MKLLVAGARMWYAINTIRFWLEASWVFAADSSRLSGVFTPDISKGGIHLILQSVRIAKAFVESVIER